MKSMFVLLATLPGFLIAADLPAPTGKLVEKGAQLELLFTRSLPISGGLTEGPIAGPDGSIYFSDIPFGKDHGKIMRFDPKTKETSVFIEDSLKSNGLKIDPKGNLVACEGSDEGGRAVARYDLKTKKRTVIVNEFMGKKFNAPNDLVFDKQGRFYFSDPKYLGAEERELEHRAVYRVDPDGKIVEITHDVEKPNGVALSPDQSTLYVGDHNNGTERIGVDPVTKKGNMTVWAFSLDEDGLVTGKRKLFHDFAPSEGCDGMTVDVQGNVYLTSRSKSRPGVLIKSPKGEEVAFIPTGEPQPEDTESPVGLPSNVCFGLGPESKTLYVTVDKSLYRIQMTIEGFRPFPVGK